MSNTLIFKVKPTLSVDSVEQNLTNYEIDKTYTTFNEVNAVIAGTTGAATSLSLPSPATLPASACFIELISDQELSFVFDITTGTSTTTFTKVKYLAGDFKAKTISAQNAGTTAANITYRIYTT